ncbi:DUF1653 domain-containing protein [soil metagenome]
MEVPTAAVLEIQPGRYQHYKNLPYRVIGTARHSETMELLVVYQSLYETAGIDPATKTTGQLWVRPATMFAETVSFQGHIVPRFKRIGD